jgi:hypothetical protein
MISPRATTTRLPIWKTSWDYRASTIKRSWWKVSKHGWGNRRRTSLTQAPQFRRRLR